MTIPALIKTWMIAGLVVIAAMPAAASLHLARPSRRPTSVRRIAGQIGKRIVAPIAADAGNECSGLNETRGSRRAS